MKHTRKHITILVAIVGWLTAGAAVALAQPVVFDVNTNHAGDTIYLGNPADIVFHVDTGADSVRAIAFAFQFRFTNGLSIGDLVLGSNFHRLPGIPANFVQYLHANYAPATDPDTVYFDFLGWGALWSGSGDVTRISFTPQDTGTIYIDSMTISHPFSSLATFALNDNGVELPLDWRPGPIVVVPCPFKVGDLNGSETITLADIILLVNYVFKGGPAPQPHVKMGDADCSQMITSGDIIHLVNYQGKGGPAPCPCFIP